MAQPFFVRLSNAGYAQYPDLFVAQVVEGFSPGSPPARPHPEPPLGIWGPNDPRPTHPIAPGGPPLGTWGPGFPYPDQGLPGQPPGIWGPNDPRPTHPIVLPDPLPPDLGQRPGLIIPPAGQPGSVTNPYPPGEVPPHAATGLQKFHIVVPGVGVIGPYTMGPGVSGPGMPPAVPAGPPPGGPPPQAPR